MMVNEVVEEVLKDINFYKNSGGGVTLSGGDPVAQPGFAGAILQQCREAGLHTVLDTCGCTRWPTLERLLKHTDLVHFDIKCIDPEKHLDATGQSNKLILDSAKQLARHRPMIVRVPLIPGFNDSPEEVRAIVNFVRAKLGPVEIDLLPYNRMGEGKYERLDRTYIPLESQAEEYILELQEIVRAGS